MREFREREGEKRGYPSDVIEAAGIQAFASMTSDGMRNTTD
jgi:hypothetical protein